MIFRCFFWSIKKNTHIFAQTSIRGIDCLKTPLHLNPPPSYCQIWKLGGGFKFRATVTWPDFFCLSGALDQFLFSSVSGDNLRGAPNHFLFCSAAGGNFRGKIGLLLHIFLNKTIQLALIIVNIFSLRRATTLVSSMWLPIESHIDETPSFFRCGRLFTYMYIV